MARQPKYTPERVDAILSAVRDGLTYRLAAAAGGISDDTLTRWKSRYADFAERLMAIEAEAAQDAMKKIKKAADEDWRAAAWILEHRHPYDYGKSVQEQQHTGKDGEKAIFIYNERPPADKVS